GEPAGKVLGPAHGVAIIAIADRCECTSPFDEISVERGWRRWIDCGNRRAPGDHKRRSRTAQQQRNDDAPNDAQLFHFVSAASGWFLAQSKGKCPHRLLIP